MLFRSPRAGVRVVADKHTNSIIVQAPVEYHETIDELIDYLDRRRPQVLIEATVASVSTGSDLTVAVELLQQENEGTVEALMFSAFGLSEVNVGTGQRTITPAGGLNTSVIDPDGTSAIFQALRTDTESQIVAEPRILVNDNAEGRFESIREEPFTSVNVGDTVSTTTFAGYAEAGLTIQVSPKISEGNFVRLDYRVTSRTFSGAGGSSGVPPARDSDTLSSSVTIPDGHTIVMGGLSQNRDSVDRDQVPLLGDIPVLGYLFSSVNESESRSNLFVFLRPVILRDEDFGDLKELSRKSLSGAGRDVGSPEPIRPPVEPKKLR